MKDQLVWEDLKEGLELPSLIKEVTTQQLVKYAGASGDFYQIHYDKDFAINTGLPGVIVHGALKNAFLGQLVTDWMGESGTLTRLVVQYKGMDVPGDTLICKGRISRKYIFEERRYVDCEIWVENGEGEKTTKGVATVWIV